MSITIKCSDCGWERTYDSEYESEIGFDLHCMEVHDKGETNETPVQD